MTRPQLPLADMSNRHPGLTEALATSYVESARVCLDRHHVSPVDFDLHVEKDRSTIVLEWSPTDDRTRAAYNNSDDATRDGAYACALAATELKYGWVAVKRAETHKGADWYVAPLGAIIEDLETCYRLEVSGTDGSEYAVKSRQKAKVEQALAGDSNLPAFAAIVGFRVCMITIQAVPES